MLKVAFLGSSTNSDIDEYKRDIRIILNAFFELRQEILILTGGYQGIMELVSRVAKEIAKENLVAGKNTFIQGILFDGYLNDPNNTQENYKINKPNDLNDAILSFSNIGARTQAIIDLADIIIALPGHSGTLYEILQTIEHIKYGMNYYLDYDINKLLIHPEWRKILETLVSYNIIDQLTLSKIPTFNFKKQKGIELFKHKILNHIEILNKKEKIVPDIENDSQRLCKDINGNTIEIFPSKLIKYEAPELPIRKRDNFFQEINITSPLVAISEKEEQDYKIFINKINSAIKGAYLSDNSIKFYLKSFVLGFDIVIKDKDKNKILALETIGTKTYCDILYNFLNERGSILLQENPEFLDTDNPFLGYINTSNNEVKEDTNYLVFHDHLPTLQSPHLNLKPTIYDWMNFLSGKDESNKIGRYGKTLIWSNKSILNKKYLVSGFLLLDLYLPKNFVEISRVLDEYLLKEVTDEVVKTIYIPEIERQAVKAIETKIISRGFSHHIGSHVMPHVSINKIRRRYIDLVGNEVPCEVLDILKSKLDEYITRRTEFLSDPECLFKPLLFFSQIVLPFVENTLIMNNLCRSENIYFRKVDDTSKNYLKIITKIKGEEIKADYKDGISYPDNFPYDGNLSYPKSKPPELLNPILNPEYLDVLVAVPDVHVIYTILENVIRNSAKHNKSDFLSGGKELVITLSLKDDVKDS